VLQYVAVCCSVLQCVVVCCSVLQCVAVCCSVLQCGSVAVCCSVLQCIAVRQCVAVCCSVLQCIALRQCVAVCCSVLQCIAVCCINSPTNKWHLQTPCDSNKSRHWYEQVMSSPIITQHHTSSHIITYPSSNTGVLCMESCHTFGWVECEIGKRDLCF